MRISDWSSDVCSSDLQPQELDETEDVSDLLAKLEASVKARREGRGRSDSGDSDGKPAKKAPAKKTTAKQAPAKKAASKSTAKRSEERRVGKECVRTWRSRWAP